MFVDGEFVEGKGNVDELMVIGEFMLVVKVVGLRFIVGILN